jgi:hypothetical protein
MYPVEMPNAFVQADPRRQASPARDLSRPLGDVLRFRGLSAARTPANQAPLAAFAGSAGRSEVGKRTLGLGRLTRARVALLTLGLVAGFTAPASAATVATDRPGYCPGDTVIVTGAGWLPYEVVTLTFVQIPMRRGPSSLTAIADSAGRIQDDEFVVGETGPGSSLTLFAHGEASDRLATATLEHVARGAHAAGTQAGGTRAPARPERAAQPQSISPGTTSPAGTGPGSSSQADS